MSEHVINQHYIPRNVLKHFARSKRIYEALLEENKIYPTNYNRSMSERYVYEHPFIMENGLEKFFQDIEDDYGPAIVKILSMISDYQNGKTTMLSIREYFETYLSAIIIYYYRSGALLHEFSFENESRQERVSKLLDKLVNTTYINTLGDTVKKFYNFSIIKSEKQQFLLSDQYISTVALSIKSRFINISNRHIGLKDVLLLVPLSDKYYIVYYDGKKPDYIQPTLVNNLSDDQVEEINKIIINNSYKKCVGSNEESLIKAVSLFKYKSPSATYVGYNSGAVSGATLKKEIFFYENDEKAWNIFTEPMLFIKYKNLGRNNLCGCGSNKKFKVCCLIYFDEVKRIWETISDKSLSIKIKVNPSAIIEQSIWSF
jgi:hypothetical protein